MTTVTLPEVTTSPPQSAALSNREPAWEVARLFPNQGAWSKYDYLDLPGNQLVEFDNGRIEVLPMPSIRHQVVLGNIFVSLRVHVQSLQLGTVLCAPMPVLVAPLKFREPDIVFTRSAAPEESDGDKYLEDAELVIEIVSEGASNRKRDLIDKRADYARAGIAEYWVVDPEPQEVTVLRLQSSEYADSDPLGISDVVRSTVVPGFEIPVAKVFAK
ncbi:MAG: Uma2 family endonuclease [Planctomycetaceae bacterium]|nr:Uma2 family endonuclease [Planctomycetaceae bacterium]